MSSGVLLFGWNHPFPGRETISTAHFDDFVKYLGEQQQKGTIDSFDIVFLDPHGGDLNGFFLIKGEPAKLGELTASTGWSDHMTRATLHLQGVGAISGVTGEGVLKRMAVYKNFIPA